MTHDLFSSARVVLLIQSLCLGTMFCLDPRLNLLCSCVTLLGLSAQKVMNLIHHQGAVGNCLVNCSVNPALKKGADCIYIYIYIYIDKH